MSAMTSHETCLASMYVSHGSQSAEVRSVHNAQCHDPFAQQNLGFAHWKKFDFIIDIEITIFRKENQGIRVRFKVKIFFLIHCNYLFMLAKKSICAVHSI